MRSSAGSIDIPWVNSQSGWGGNDAACRRLCSCRGMFACLLVCIEHRPPLLLLPYTPTSTLITASLHSNIHPYHCFLTLQHSPLSLLPYTPTCTRITSISTLITVSLHSNIHPYHCFLTLQRSPLSLIPYTPTSTLITQTSTPVMLLYTLTPTRITASSHSNIHPYHSNIHPYHCFLTI